MKVIETTYRGYSFRSRTEARWAVLMEKALIPFSYEPEGFRFEDGTKYLPDFYLPDQNAFLECKGILDHEDQKKIEQLAYYAEKDIVIGWSDLTFDIIGGDKISKSDNPWLVKCHSCGKVHFLDGDGSWACKCCGYYDGDGTFEILMRGDERTGFENDNFLPLLVARSARFEHGEHGPKTIGEIIYGI